MKKRKARIYRQGDVFLIAIGSIPAQSKTVKRQGGRIILAEGEATGHHHAISESGATLAVLDDRAEMAEAARRLLAEVGLTTEIREEEIVGFLDVADDAKVNVTHDEHAAIALTPGDKLVVFKQREYTPQGLRSVAD